MSTINDLNTTNTLEDDDKLIVWKRQSGATRAITATNAAQYFSDEISGNFQPFNAFLASIASQSPNTQPGRYFEITGVDTVNLITGANLLANIGGLAADPTLLMYVALGMTDGKIVRGTGVDTAELIDQEDIEVIASGSVTPRTLADRFADVVNVLDYGADPTGVTDSTAGFLLAEAAGGHIFMPEGTYLLDALVLTASGRTWEGAGEGKTILKLANGSDAPMILANTLADLKFYGFSVDGNKANQTPAAEGSGIKLIKCQGARLSDLEIYDCEGHGVHLNNQGATVTDQTFTNVRVRNCGSGPTNTFGSNFAVTNGNGVIFTACQAFDSAKAGWRVSGTGFVWNGCTAKRNGNAGIVPVSSEFTDFAIIGGEFSDSGPGGNNDGIRLVDCDRGEIVGVNASGNTGAGIHLLNGCSNITVTGGTFRNNGQHADPPDANEARSGIAITNSGAACTNIVILGAKLLDDQGAATQDYGIEINGSANNVLIDACIFSANQVGPLNYATSANDVRIGNLNIGLSLPHQEIGNSALTGSTTATTLFTKTITANEFGRRGVLRGRFAATCAGGAGTKTFRLVFGGAAPIAAFTSASGFTGDVVIEWEAYATNTSGLRIFVTAMAGTSAYQADYAVPTPTMTSAWDMVVTGQLSDAADTITGTMFALERVR